MSIKKDDTKAVSSDTDSVSDLSAALAADKINALAVAVGEAFGIVETDVFLRSDIETDEDIIAVCGAENPEQYSVEAIKRSAENSENTNRGNSVHYSVEAIKYTADDPVNTARESSGQYSVEAINRAAETLRVLSSPSGYVFANALTNADTQRNFNIRLNVGGVNFGDRAVRTNGGAVNIDWRDAMMNNGGGQ